MIPSICHKMQSLIKGGITEENHVVYLLTCIRKTLEQEDDTEQWNILKFYCDWALHAKLTGLAAQNILAFFNKANAIMTEGDKELPSEIKNISGFNQLTSEVERFLNAYEIRLPEYISSDWSRFTYLYACIIEDCPLIINSHITQDSGIDQVTVKVKLAEDIKQGQQYYQVSWRIKDNQGNIGELYVMNSFDANICLS